MFVRPHGPSLSEGRGGSRGGWALPARGQGFPQRHWGWRGAGPGPEHEPTPSPCGHQQGRLLARDHPGCPRSRLRHPHRVAARSPVCSSVEYRTVPFMEPPWHSWSGFCATGVMHIGRSSFNECVCSTVGSLGWGAHPSWRQARCSAFRSPPSTSRTWVSRPRAPLDPRSCPVQQACLSGRWASALTLDLTSVGTVSAITRQDVWATLGSGLWLCMWGAR